MKKIIVLMLILVCSSALAQTSTCDLDRAVSSGDMDRVQKFVAAGYGLNGMCGDRTPLMNACGMVLTPHSNRENYVEIVEFLLSKNVTIDIKNSQGQTALMQVVKHQSVDPAMLTVITLLIKKGADIDVADRQGNTPRRVGLTHPSKEVSDIFYRFVNNVAETKNEQK
jgi:ankyrin repeat protein